MGEGKFADREKYAFPTFIMMDLNIHGGGEADSFDILQHLKNNPEWRIIPTVVLSSSEEADDIKKAYMLGATCYHVKPIDYLALRKQLKILHDYWMTCRVPAVDRTGRQLPTKSAGRPGERFAQLSGGTQTRKKPDKRVG
jgi:CheY-like chemotaxis protein